MEVFDKKYSLMLFFLLFTSSVFSQQAFSLKGKVQDKTTNEPIPFCNVFLEGTTRGTQTDIEGNFELPNVAEGSYRLVVSMVGYLPIEYPIKIDKKPIKFSFFLETDIKSLQEVTVKGKRDKSWEKDFKLFEKEFLGENSNPKEVSIINREVVDFQRIKGVFKATASQEIAIENRTLGFKINYILQDFTKTSDLTSYKGLVRFKEMTPTDEKENSSWIKNREKAYLGSVNHFLKSLLSNSATTEGFDAFYINPNFINQKGNALRFYDISGKRHLKMDSEKIAKRIASNEFEIYLEYPVELVYNKQFTRKIIFQDAPFPYSQLIQKSKLIVSKDGFLANPYALELRGEMGKQAMANMLPSDYFSNENERKQPTASISLKPEVAKISRQKIYLHTDKSGYYTNDTLWYKTYVTDSISNRLATSVQKFFVEIYDAKKQTTPVLYQVGRTTEGGVAWSYFVIPDSLAAGRYVLKAYTNAMKNESEPSVFMKEISIKNFKTKIVENLEKSDQQLTATFMPEGGQYLWGVPAKIGVKLNQKLSNAIEGTVLDAKDRIVSKFEINELGMGSFLITNTKDNKHKVKIEEQLFDLPNAQNDGYSLTVENTSEDSLKLTVHSTISNENSVVLLQARGGINVPFTQEIVNNKATFSISKNELPTGICKVTVFNESLRPQAERLVFIKNAEDDADVKLTNSLSERYGEVSLSLETKNASHFGEFSLSITDASQVDFSSNAQTICSYLLLTSEVRGSIENPNYYFVDNSDQRRKALDDLLLTQGWRKYNWSDSVFNNNAKSANYEGLTIRGRAYADEEKTKPMVSTEMLALPITGTHKPISFNTDLEGNFLLENIDFESNTAFVVKAMNDRGKQLKIWLELQQYMASLPLPIYENPKRNSISPDNNNVKYEAYLLKQQTRMLDEITVTAKKERNYDFDLMGNKIIKIYGKPDGIIQVDDRTVGGNVIEIIRGKIPAIQIRGDGNELYPYEYSMRGIASISGAQNPPLILLDGVVYDAPKTEKDPLMSLNVRDIDWIEYVVNAGTSAYGVRGSGGIVAIYTKRGKNGYSNIKSSLSVLNLQGFESNKTFFEPKNTPENQQDVRDLLLWKPSIQLNSEKPFTVNFKNNDIATKALVVLEGVLSDGTPVSKVKLVNVN